MAETSSYSKLQMKNSKFRSMLYSQKLTQELLDLQKSATLCDVELVCQDATISGKTATLCDVQLEYNLWCQHLESNSEKSVSYQKKDGRGHTRDALHFRNAHSNWTLNVIFQPILPCLWVAVRLWRVWCKRPPVPQYPYLTSLQTLYN